MAIKRKAFEPQELEENRREQDVVSVKLVGNEREYLEALKRYYQTDYESTALKKAAFDTFLKYEKLAEFRRKK